MHLLVLAILLFYKEYIVYTFYKTLLNIHKNEARSFNSFNTINILNLYLIFSTLKLNNTNDFHHLIGLYILFIF